MRGPGLLAMRILIVVFLSTPSCTDVEYVNDPHSYYYESDGHLIHVEVSTSHESDSFTISKLNRQDRYSVPITNVEALYFQSNTVATDSQKMYFHGQTVPVIEGEFVKKGKTERCQDPYHRCRFWEVEIYDLRLEYPAHGTASVYRFSKAPVCGGVMPWSAIPIDSGLCF